MSAPSPSHVTALKKIVLLFKQQLSHTHSNRRNRTLIGDKWILMSLTHYRHRAQGSGFGAMRGAVAPHYGQQLARRVSW